MSFEEFLKLIQPNLTIFAVLFTFSIVLIQLFWKFLKYEGIIREENLNKIKDLNSSFRSKKIEGKIKSLLTDFKQNGFKLAINKFLNLIYPSEFDASKGIYVRTLKDQTEIEKLVEEVSITKVFEDSDEKINEESEYFFSTVSGQDFLYTLDRLYEEKNKINKTYFSIKRYCKGVWICCLVLSIMSLLGIIIILSDTPEKLFTIWIYTSVLFFIGGLISFGLLFYKRDSINEEWEKQQLHG